MCNATTNKYPQVIVEQAVNTSRPNMRQPQDLCKIPNPDLNLCHKLRAIPSGCQIMHASVELCFQEQLVSFNANFKSACVIPA
jgi:hypothetical protein